MPEKNEYSDHVIICITPLHHEISWILLGMIMGIIISGKHCCVDFLNNCTQRDDYHDLQEHITQIVGELRP